MTESAQVTDTLNGEQFRWQHQGEGLHTWYRVFGELEGAGLPLVVAHGGPGATHDYLLALQDLAGPERAVVLYDQVGNGRSDHFPDRGADFYTVGLFVAELQALVAHLELTAGHHLLGQSWGGFLAQEYALTQPAGLRSLVLANTACSFPAFVRECNLLRAALPPDVQATLVRHEEAGTTGDPEYVEACQVFYDRHVCRLDPWPPEVVEAFAWIDRDPTVYHTMNGPSEFHVIGSIRDWQCADRLAQITVPTLLVSGRYDEAAPALQEQLVAGLPTVRWEIFEQSSHMPHVEERERYRAVVDDWLRARED